MKQIITHVTHYRYTAPVNYSIQTLRLTPREAGRDETQEGLLAAALEHGIELAGYRLSAEFVRQFQALVPPEHPRQSEIAQADIGGGGLWLRAEPDEDRAQADALAAIVAIGVTA